MENSVNVVERVVQRYWGLSQAWRRGIEAEQYTCETFMKAIGDVSWHQSRVGQYANDLLQEVIRDKKPEPVEDARIYEWPIRPAATNLEQESLVQLQQQA